MEILRRTEADQMDGPSIIGILSTEGCVTGAVNIIL